MQLPCHGDSRQVMIFGLFLFSGHWSDIPFKPHPLPLGQRCCATCHTASVKSRSHRLLPPYRTRTIPIHDSYNYTFVKWWKTYDDHFHPFSQYFPTFSQYVHQYFAGMAKLCQFEFARGYWKSDTGGSASIGQLTRAGCTTSLVMFSGTNS